VKVLIEINEVDRRALLEMFRVMDEIECGVTLRYERRHLFMPVEWCEERKFYNLQFFDCSALIEALEDA
jgi:hypothetical protein